MELQFKLEVFEGPLDLLLHLIDKNKVDIYDIPIAEITDQYMEYVDEMKRQDLNIMSEFLVMAATLLAIKAKMLLPSEEVEEEEEDPRAELVEKLVEYKMYKCMSYELKDMQVSADQVLYKLPTIPQEVLSYEEPIDVMELTSDLTLRKLNEIFQELLRKEKGRVDPIRSKFGQIKREEISLEDKIAYLKDFCLSHESFSFRALFKEDSTKTEIIVTFLAVLELIKSGVINIRQDQIFDDIKITTVQQKAA